MDPYVMRTRTDDELIEMLATPGDFEPGFCELANEELVTCGFEQMQIAELVADLQRNLATAEEIDQREFVSQYRHYPSLVRRILAITIDGFLILACVIGISQLLQEDATIRVALLMGMYFIYEPLLTSRACTLGQRMLGIRIRRMSDHERISVPKAFLRVFIKGLLGIYIIFTMPFSHGRRGLHDIVSGSVVIFADRA